MQKYRVAFLALAASLFLAATAVADEPTKKLPSQSAGGLPPSKDSATLTGTILFKGTKPEIKPLADIAGSAFCKEHQNGPTPMKDTFVFGKNGDHDTLQNVLVYISKGTDDKEFPTPKTPVILDQVGCIYLPHVVAVMTGQPLEVRNSDATLHNVMASPRENTPFNFGMPVKDGTNTLTFDAPEFKINTKCFMHPWMSAYIHVLDHPFFAVTGADGTFTITGLPAGDYELSVLHEASLVQPENKAVPIKVAAGEKKQVDFTYQMKADD